MNFARPRTCQLAFQNQAIDLKLFNLTTRIEGVRFTPVCATHQGVWLIFQCAKLVSSTPQTAAPNDQC